MNSKAKGGTDNETPKADEDWGRNVP